MVTIAKVCGYVFQDIHTMTIDEKYVMMYVITSDCKSKNCQRVAKQARVVSSICNIININISIVTKY